MSHAPSSTTSRREQNTQKGNQQLALTFVLGPPTSGIDAVAFPQVAAEKGITPAEFWFQVVPRTIDDLLACDPDGWAMLDIIFSGALGEQVMVWDVEHTINPYLGFNFPGLTIDPNKVLTLTGPPTSGNLADRETLYAIADALMDLTRSDLAVCTITSEKGEVVFPFPRRHEKRPHDA